MNLMSTRAFRLMFCGAVVGASPAGTISASPVMLAAGAQTQWHLATRSLEAPGVPFAADELRRYFKQITGAALAVTNDVDAQPTIVIGLRADLADNGIAGLPPPAAKGYDGYSIVIAPTTDGDKAVPRIVIAGDNGRGVIYGVYDLLERFGCRWCYPAQNAADPEVVPRLERLTIEAGAWSVASPMKNRICNGDAWFFEMNMANAAAQLDWAMKNRYNAMGWQCNDKDTVPLAGQYEALRQAGLLDQLARRGMFLHGPGHSFQHFLRAQDHFEQHPDWFGMRDGKRRPQNFFGAQFCWSNAEARKTFIDNLEAFVLGSPAIKIVCIVPFDGGQACGCPECKKIGASNAAMMLMREACERLEKSAPGVELETVGGYGALSEPPTHAETHPRQRIIWAHWGRYYGSGYDDPSYGLRKNLEAWQKAAKGGLTVCQYYTDNFAEPWVMPPFTKALEGDRRYFLAKGIDSVYMLMWSPGYWWNHALNGYLAGRCFYDPSLDPYKALLDYALHYYGLKAGPLIANYYDEWARVIELAYRVRDDSLPRHWQMLAEQRRKWIDPAVEAVKEDAVLSARVGRVEKLHRLAERLCGVHRRRYEIQLLRERGEFELARQKLEIARLDAESVLYMFYALADLDQGLIERKEIGFLIKMKVRDWIDAEEKAIAEKNRKVDKSGVWRELKPGDILPDAPAGQ